MVQYLTISCLYSFVRIRIVGDLSTAPAPAPRHTPKIRFVDPDPYLEKVWIGIHILKDVGSGSVYDIWSKPDPCLENGGSRSVFGKRSDPEVQKFGSGPYFKKSRLLIRI